MKIDQWFIDVMMASGNSRSPDCWDSTSPIQYCQDCSLNGILLKINRGGIVFYNNLFGEFDACGAPVLVCATCGLVTNQVGSRVIAYGKNAAKQEVASASAVGKHKCKCDLKSVIMVTGCVCGGC